MKTPKGDTPVMTEITRNEMKDTLSAIENRMDKRIDRMEQAELQRREWAARDRLYSERFEATNRRLEDRESVMDAKLDAFNASIKQVSSTIAGFSTTLPELLKEVKSSNRNTVLAILAIGVATVLGLWGANSTIIGSAGSIFQSGYEQAANAQDVKNLMKEVKAGSDETKALLEAIRAQRS
ncbi:hypothetical protein [Pseudomonas syringae group genomosp. 3]|uniref:Uncharacterized protein n=1 Tax=Pseudomonas syringae pv. primulae TaxID=251707 RepID=A0A3M5TN79_9PSED|nr:hypothetical protein [Pseudomonas syringae group genomosp. 3]RMO70554.1 hypothetical protein ALQ36_100851 [Pseudomonas syringae pv. primulae]RMU34774.1 hypothetical protein ALP30_100948 [Pseudomonas syringae pv. primulae]